MESDMVMHHGGCHCRRVRWRFQAPSSVVAWNCNCSVCSMRGIIQFVVPSEKFELLGDSKECLTTYTFGTHTAKHTFCKFCGITSFLCHEHFQMGFQFLSDVLTQVLSLLMRLSILMGGIGKAHTKRNLLHALKVQAEVSLFLPPLSSADLPK